MKSDRNHQVTKVQKLLDKRGAIQEAGWATKPVWKYDSKEIKAARFRIKEWDYYLVMNKDFGAAFTLSDDGYIGLQSVSLLDFKSGWQHTETILNALPMGKLKLPPSTDSGNTEYEDKRLKLSFLVEKGKRTIKGQFRNFYRGKPLTCHIELQQPDMDSMVIATPFPKDKKAFYYNQKINCMPAKGYVEFDGRLYEFHPETDYGTLDWGRGVWTYDNTWYWGSGNGNLNGHHFGFNIGYGFGDTTKASENILFYDGKAHKLEDVRFHVPEGDYLKPWTFTSSDGRFEMDFKPVMDRSAKISALIIESDQHQVFGKMTGKAVLDDGTVLHIKDMMCFAEKVHNRY